MPRKLKIENRGDFAAKKTYPLIRVRGKWLQEAGFEPGTYAQVIVENKKITLIPFMEVTNE